MVINIARVLNHNRDLTFKSLGNGDFTLLVNLHTLCVGLKSNFTVAMVILYLGELLLGWLTLIRGLSGPRFNIATCLLNNEGKPLRLNSSIAPLISGCILKSRYRCISANISCRTSLYCVLFPIFKKDLFVAVINADRLSSNRELYLVFIDIDSICGDNTSSIRCGNNRGTRPHCRNSSTVTLILSVKAAAHHNCIPDGVTRCNCYIGIRRNVRYARIRTPLVINVVSSSFVTWIQRNRTAICNGRNKPLLSKGGRSSNARRNRHSHRCCSDNLKLANSHALSILPIPLHCGQCFDDRPMQASKYFTKRKF